MVALLTIATTAPTVVAEWEEDGWLSNIIGPERLAHGDEFGCHGYEGVDTTEELWVIEACRDYIVEFTNASRWGSDPISFGVTDQQLDDITAAALVEAGFEIVGDLLTEVPEGLTAMTRNGGSLEQGIADRELLESIEANTLVSIYWEARKDDLKLREDGEVMSWLEQQDVWFTTWGEWHHHRLSGNEVVVTVEGSTITATLSNQSSWSVPGTVKIQFDTGVRRVTDSSGSDLTAIEVDQRNLLAGWSEIADGMLLTIEPGTTVLIELEGEPNSTLSTPQVTFNGLHHAVTVVGHHTTNLFQWSSDFQESDLVFTWLIERPAEIEMNWALPVIAAAVLIAVPVSINYLVKRDQRELTE
tara:strand:- start:2648 stop:3721 length:1074 start_codon:yes stop_codon:yes gene_type:complete